MHEFEVREACAAAGFDGDAAWDDWRRKVLHRGVLAPDPREPAHYMVPIPWLARHMANLRPAPRHAATNNEP